MEYALNDLPKFSPWPSRLLGIEKFVKRKKTKKELIREYEEEKWSSLLKKAKSDNNFKFKYVDSLIHDSNVKSLCFDNGKFVLKKLHQARKELNSNIIETINGNIKGIDSILEIGAGYGALLFDLAKNKKFKQIQFYATEYTNSGLELLNLISKTENTKIITGKCDLTKKPINSITISGELLIITCFTISCLPLLKESAIDEIIKLSPKRVIFFEPVYEHCLENSIFSLLRRKYIEINDYNKTFLTLLKKQELKGKLKIVKEIDCVFGINAIFPYSVIIWEPKYSSL